MITYAQKPGIFAYWVTETNYVTLNGRHYQENQMVFGQGRFIPARLKELWEIGFIKVFKDGDHLCALVGDDLQSGTAEFAPLTDARLADQITDLMHAYRKAHPDRPYDGRCVYWEPHEIQMMADQCRARTA